MPPNGGGDYFANGVADPVLIIDLGADRGLSEISTWGYANSNTNGGREFSLPFRHKHGRHRRLRKLNHLLPFFSGCLQRHHPRLKFVQSKRHRPLCRN
jgi:hypothetical protein